MKMYLLLGFVLIIGVCSCGHKSSDSQGVISDEPITEEVLKEINTIDVEADSLAAETAKLLEELNKLEN